MRGARTFTTYMNIEPGKGNDQALTRFERQAEASLRRVSATARKASTAATTMTPGAGSPAQIQAMAAAERSRAAAIQRTATVQRQADAAARRTAGGFIQQSNAASRAAASTNRLERSLRLASVAANVAQGPLGPIAGRLSAMATAVNELSGFRFGLVGAGAAIAGYVRYASTAQDLVSRLRPLYETQVQVNAAFKDAQYIADQARVGIEPVIDLYARLTLAGREYGLTQQRISRLTEVATKAARLSGGTAISQEAGLYQFAQGIGSGGLQGDELRSVRENTLRLAKAIADGMGVPIAELKKLGKEGKLTFEVVEDALVKQAATLDAELAKLPPTISSATTQLSNAFTDLVVKTENATGVTGAFAEVILLLAENLDSVARGAVAVTLAYAGFRGGQVIANNYAEVRSWSEKRKEMLRTANEARSTAAAQLASSRDRIRTLKTEQAALRQQIVAEQQLANQRRRTALSVAQNVRQNFVVNDPREIAAYRQAVDQARVAQDNLAASKNRLRNITGQLRGEYGTLVTATGNFSRATRAANAAAISFRNAARGLWAAINPLGVALAIAIPLLIEWAFRQEAAAGAADRMAEAQMQLGRLVDQTTGKILEQNAALVQSEILQRQKSASEALSNYQASRELVTSLFGRRRLPVRGFVRGLDPRIRQIAGQYEAREITAAQASEALNNLKALDAISEDFRQKLTTQLGKTVTLAREAVMARASAALLSGQNTAENRRRAFGNFTGEDIDLTTGMARATDDAADAKKRLAKATDDAAKAEREAQRIERRTDKRDDIVGRYNEPPRAMQRAARDIRELQQLIGETIEARNEFGEAMTDAAGKVVTRIYTQEMADADRAAIEYGVRQPIRDAIAEQERGIQLADLRLGGYDLEAEALERALALQEQIGEVTREEYEALLGNVREQEEINDLLASRERQVGQILDLANQTRDSFEDMLVGLRTDPIGSLKKFGADVINNITRIEARRITEQLFAGADAKLRDLVRGSNGVDRAADILAQHVRTAADSATDLASANDNLASATELAARRITDAANGISAGGSSIPGLAPSTTASTTAQASSAAQKAAQAVDGAMSVVTAVTGGASGGLVHTARDAVRAAAGGTTILGGIAAGAASVMHGVGQVGADGVITVRGERQSGLPSGSQAYASIFEELGTTLDKTFKSGTFFSGIGKGVGQAFGDAATGTMASSFASMLGIKQSATGAAIGGAIGSFIPIPGASIIGGLLGGTIGGLFKKSKHGSAVVTGGGVGGAHGSNSGRRKGATGLAGKVHDRLTQIAEALGADVSSGGKVTIGTYKDEFRVNITGSSKVGGFKHSESENERLHGLYNFGDDQQAAIEFAVRDLIADGVLTGISAASQKILRNSTGSNQELEMAVEKAVAIESIPKRLLEKTDPVRFAVQQLNDEFTKLISYLKEGGATAEQFADAQKLYELERADAIEQASQQASAAIQAYLDEMRGGASSPLNRRTVYENAASQLNDFRADIDAGKAVDEQALLVAARNFQDASQALYGSDQNFFEDFEELFALLGRARDNVATEGGELPGSPFESDAEVRRILGQTVDATNSQTDVLGSKLDQIRDNLASLGGSTNSPSTGAVGLLPGFRYGGGLTERRVFGNP